jgi:hypothetical protein
MTVSNYLSKHPQENSQSPDRITNTPVSKLGGVPQSSRQGFSESSGSKPHKVGEEKSKESKNESGNFGHDCFQPPSPPIFPLYISVIEVANTQIGDRHCMFISIEHAVTIADF